MKLDAAHQRPWEIAEVVFGLPFLLSLAAQWLLPLSLPPTTTTLRLVLIPVGMALIVTGVGIVVLARREFARHGQPTDPGRPTTKVIRTGVFAFSRNPLYLGSVLVILGTAFVWTIPWALITLSLSLILCHYLLIIPEERYLTAKLGGEYEAYVASTHRWLGRKQTTA